MKRIFSLSSFGAVMTALAVIAVVAFSAAGYAAPPDLALMGLLGTTLAAHNPRDYFAGDFDDQPVIAADIIYQGAAVGDNGSGYARPLAAGDPFMGFAEETIDNSGGAAGAEYVRVKTAGRVKLPITSLAITDKGKLVYASDDNTFTLTQGGNTCIGFVAKWHSTGYGIVQFAATQGVVTELTDSSGGTASDTLAAIGASYSQTEVRNSVASLAAKVNALIRRMGN